MVAPDWRPRLVALDIDGTLLKWIEGQGAPHPEISPRVQAAVRRAQEAGAHVVLSSGRSPYGMTPVADDLGLAELADDRLWIVASNGAVLVRYPPFEVVREETFDAGPAVRAILERQPTARVAIEERGVGYRVTVPFPDGELHGEMIETPLDELVSEQVSRVIIRDPEASADEFVALADELGLHGTNYVVGWTAWLDLSPMGVTKASGLEQVAAELGLTRDDALAIGDGRNDLEMLGWAARGVAMGQSIPEVHAAADVSTDSVYDDGAAIELERWFGAG